MEPSQQFDQLWDAFKGGNKSAFRDIYQIYGTPLFNYGSRITSDTALVEDSVQDLFVDLWNRRRHLSRTSSVKLYLFKALRYKILRNKKISHDDKLEHIDSHISLLKNASYEDDYIELELRSMQLQHLRDSLAKLPARQREAINLRYFHDFSNEQIADIMGITYSSGCKFIYAGLKTLAENFKVAVMHSLTFLVLMF
jgi:RNA polymerase sigma factor (sigma-70 family)